MNLLLYFHTRTFESLRLCLQLGEAQQAAGSSFEGIPPNADAQVHSVAHAPANADASLPFTIPTK